jgi:hypothetical protein
MPAERYGGEDRREGADVPPAHVEWFRHH